MIAATVMSLIFTPVFYVVMQRLSGSRMKKPEKEPEIKGVTGDPAVREGT
jgi:flagellar biosynthesis protein FlhB